jgi:hypothetical protein
MSLSVTVMAHPSRAEWAERLARQFDCPVVWDAVGSVWDTGRRALLLSSEFDSTHHLVIQDDALPADGFLGACQTFIERYPENPIGLYASYKLKQLIKRAKREDERYLKAEGPRWGVAVITPTKHIKDMVLHGDRLDMSNYDLRMMDYWMMKGIPCVYPLPSIVNHRPVTENPSLVSEQRDTTRQAIWATNDARKFSW